jgi:hypothetical protein
MRRVKIHQQKAFLVCALKKKRESLTESGKELFIRAACVFYSTSTREEAFHMCAAHFAGIVRLFVRASDSRLFLFPPEHEMHCVFNFSLACTCRLHSRCSFFSSQNAATTWVFLIYRHLISFLLTSKCQRSRLAFISVATMRLIVAMTCFVIN